MYKKYLGPTIVYFFNLLFEGPYIKTYRGEKKYGNGEHQTIYSLPKCSITHSHDVINYDMSGLFILCLSLLTFDKVHWYKDIFLF